MSEGQTVFWVGLGVAGNAVFGARFIVQWIASERAGRSVVPKSFWYISLVGALLSLIYAIYLTTTEGSKGIPVILGTAPNALVYVRNLMLIEREAKAKNHVLEHSANEAC